jgi:hypothetical protein
MISSDSCCASDSTINTAASVPATINPSAVFALGLTRVQHVLAVDVTHAGSAHRAVERNAADAQSRAGSDQSCNVSVHFGVQRHGVDDHMHFVEETFGEQRTDRAVDQAAGQGFKFAGLGFALEEAAGDLACGVGLLDVVNGQGKKSWPGLEPLEATTVASTTVPSMSTSTAPVAWRAISPVSMTTLCWPHWNDLVTLLNMVIGVLLLVWDKPVSPTQNRMPFQKKATFNKRLLME